MYGLIHRGLESMVTSQYGADIWEKILTNSDAGSDSFLTMRSYPDQITLSLISSASRELELSASECLEAFGEYWLLEFAPGNYNTLLESTGREPIEFLKNLDDLHDHISSAFTEFSPPSFVVDDVTEEIFFLHYRSSRKGLESFVVGLLKGLKKRFEVDIGIEVETREELEVGEHIVFKLTLPPSGRH
jgi:hypothetical protein